MVLIVAVFNDFMRVMIDVRKIKIITRQRGVFNNHFLDG